MSEDAQGEPTVFDVQLKLEDNKKEDTITNTYKTGEFTVAKAVQGDLSKKTDKFDIIVTLTSQKKVAADIKIGDATIASGEWKGTGPYTYTHTIDDITANTTAVTFSNIPYDVVVTVKESAEQMNGYTRVDTFNSLTVNENLNDGNNDIVVINEKNSEILTGIIVNNMPYIVALVVLVAAAVVFFRRRREF